MSQTNSYKVVREGSQFGKPGTLVPLTANQASAFERTGEIVFEKAGEPLPPKGAKADAALRARITQLESDLQAALAGSADATVLKAAQDAQAEAERLLAASKEANALADAELGKAQAALAEKQAELDARTAELTDARADLQKAADDFAALQEERDADEAQLAELGFTRDDEGNLVPPPAAAPADPAAG